MDQILVNFENLRVKHAGGTRLWTGEQIELITCTGCTQEETRSALVEVSQLLKSRDPLIGHVACSTLVILLCSALMVIGKDETASCLVRAVTLEIDGGDPMEVVHIVDLLHRLISLPSRAGGGGNGGKGSSSHPELIDEDDYAMQQGGDDMDGNTPSRSLALLGLKVLMDQTCISLKSICIEMLERPGRGKRRQRNALPMIMLLKATRGAVSYMADDDDDEVDHVALSRMLVSILETWPFLVNSVVEVQRQYLELALALMRMEGGGGARREMLLDLLVKVCEEGKASFASEEGKLRDEEEEDGGRLLCSLARRRRSKEELIPYLLALTMKVMRYCVTGFDISIRAAEGAAQADTYFYEILLKRLMKCDLVMTYLCQWAGDEEDEDALVEALSDHDDLLIEVMNDALVTYSLFFDRDEMAIHGSLEMEIKGFITSLRPEAMFAKFLMNIGEDEKVFLDFLVSNETCALEYLTRITKHITRCLESGARQSDPTTIIISFLLRLLQRLQALTSKGLFPYNADPLLARLRQLLSLAT